MKNKIIQRLESIDDLPSLPVVIMKLTEAIQNSNSSASDVAKIMEGDPAIMARVLKIVNSSFYSNTFSKEPITNMRQAIVRLGYDAIRNIALTSSVFSVFTEDHSQVFDRKEFWRHCICTGIVANIVVRFCDLDGEELPLESVALGGLLHDIGKIVFEQYFYELFTKILEYSHSRNVPLYLVERKVFDTSHSEIGTWLGKRWKLSPDLLACIEYHHYPHRAPKQYRKMVGVVHVADYICNIKNLGQSGNPRPPLFNQEIWDELKLDTSMITEILDISDEESKKSEILLDLV